MRHARTSLPALHRNSSSSKCEGGKKKEDEIHDSSSLKISCKVVSGTAKNVESPAKDSQDERFRFYMPRHQVI